MIKAVIFDFFGVLVTEGVTSFNQDFFYGDKGKLIQVDELVDKLNMAVLPYNDFISQLAELASVNEEQVREYLDVNHPNRPLLDYIKDMLKPKYKIGIISNAGGDWIYEMLDQKDITLFDDIVLSHSEGVAKPEPSIYQTSLNNLGVRANGAIFIDDIERYCEGARAVGMQAILYKDFDQMKTDLEKLLSSGLDD